MDYLALMDTIDQQFPLAPRLRARGLRLTARGWRAYTIAKQAGEAFVLVASCLSFFLLLVLLAP